MFDLSLEVLRVVEDAAIASARTMGMGDPNGSDHAAIARYHMDQRRHRHRRRRAQPRSGSRREPRRDGVTLAWIKFVECGVNGTWSGIDSRPRRRMCDPDSIGRALDARVAGN